MTDSIKITENNPDLALLERKWGRPEFSTDDGIGPLESLYQASDSIVAVAGSVQDHFQAIGSGVMISPGLLLTATHVLEEFPRSGSGPVFLTFLPGGIARAWLPTALVTCSGPSEFNELDVERKINSDISLVACGLNSDAQADFPLSLAPLEVCLPLPGARLWAVGFRQGEIAGDLVSITPFVSSGLVTHCYPDGRGERMPSPCVEVAMEVLGGMSGGPVFNTDGRLVGLVSSGLDCGPTYVTLIWDTLRLTIDHLPENIWPDGPSSLHDGVKLGLVKIKGNFESDEQCNTTLNLSGEEMECFRRYMGYDEN